MTLRNPMASLRLAPPLAGTLAAVLSALALGLAAVLLGLPAWGVIAGAMVLGIGIALGLDMARRRHAERRARPARTAPEPAAEHDPVTALGRLRRPAPAELDQRQQRIDPTGKLTEDPNRRGDDNSKQPGGSRPSRRDGDG